MTIGHTTRRWQRGRGGLAGFTLVELIMVVAIIALTAKLAIPMFRDSDAARLRAAANLLMGDLAFAQAESIAHANDLRLLVVEQASNRYRISTASAPTVAMTNPTDKQAYQVTMGSGRASQMAGVTIQSVSLGGDDRIRFGPYGQLDQTAQASITLACGSRRLTIYVDPITGETSLSAMQ